jgi:hypothetical protein
VLQKIEGCVVGLIKQLTPDPEEQCVAAFEKLGQLVRMSKSMTTADDVTPYFTAGIQEVISRLDAFRTGFARTFDQENADGLAKASCFKLKTSDLAPSEFVQYAGSVIQRALKCAEAGVVGKALEALHTLVSDIRKAESFEDSVADKITVTVDNDPMRIVETEASGTTAPSGTSAPQDAASNYVTNPADVGAAAPSTAPNPSTESAESLRPATPAGDSNFVAKAEVDVVKALDSIVGAVSKFDGTKSMVDAGWALDLNSAEFRHGNAPRERF